MIHETMNKDIEIFAGIDTHRDTYAIANCDAFGSILKNTEFKSTKDGISKAISWLCDQGEVLAVGIEGTGSYGKNIAAELQKRQIQVLEVTAPLKKERRSKGKTDMLDAQSAAQTARDFFYGGTRATNACVAKDRTSELEEIASVKTAYDAVQKMRTQSINQLKAAILTAPIEVRESLRGLSSTMQVKQCAAMRINASKSKYIYIKTVLKKLAKRILEFNEEIAAYKKLLDEFANKYLKNLMELKQVGSISAIQFVLTCGENIERFKSEASFASYCGVAPVPVSSGQHCHMRLSRAGNRKANSTLYMIAVGRMRNDERTKTYIEKKLSEGKSNQDAIRCLKRYIAREVFASLKKDLNQIKISS